VTITAILPRTQRVPLWNKSNKLLLRPIMKPTRFHFLHVTPSSSVLPLTSQSSTTKSWRTIRLPANLLIKPSKMLLIRSMSLKRTTSEMLKALLNSLRRTWPFGRKRRMVTTKLMTYERKHASSSHPNSCELTFSKDSKPIILNLNQLSFSPIIIFNSLWLFYLIKF